MRIRPTDALQILQRRGWQPNDAAGNLTLAMRGDTCGLYCNDNPVATKIKLTLAVEAHAESDGGWSATIVSTARESWEHPPDHYRWEFHESEVEALPPPPSDRGAHDRPRHRASRMQQLIRQIADEKWPDGSEATETRHIIKTVGGTQRPGRACPGAQHI